MHRDTDDYMDDEMYELIFGDFADKKTERLQRSTKELSKVVTKLNLYITFCCKKTKPDKVRLQEELDEIKHLVAKVEKRMGYL